MRRENVARVWLAITLVALAAAFAVGLALSAKSAPDVEIGTALVCEMQDDGSILCWEVGE